VQALWWCADAFSEEQIARNFDYYEARTVRDSSLSASVQGVIAARTGHLDLAYAYLRTAALVDLRDLQGDTAKGLHLASLAGAWHTLVAGIGGLDEEADVLSLAPRLPARLTRVSFRLRWRGNVVAVEVTQSGTRLTLPEIDGDGRGDGNTRMEVSVDGERHTLTAAAPVVVPLRVIRPLLDPPAQPPTREPII
jgi:alpha,alpha-trehalose phosphorylase